MDPITLDFDVVSMEWRVLIAAPSAAHRRQISDIMGRYPMRLEVIELAEGEGLLSALTSNSFDVAFVDTSFQQLHGLAALKEARNQGSHTFVTLVADRFDEEVIGIAKALRAYDYLVRPLNSLSVFKTLDNYAHISRPMKVLVVDPSPDVRDLVRHVLSQSVFRTDMMEAPDGVSAVEDYAKYLHEIVFLDADLTGLSGRDTWRMLRAFNRHVRVVVMASKPLQEGEYEGVQVVMKPFTARQVDEAMHRILGLAEPFSDKE